MHLQALNLLTFTVLPLDTLLFYLATHISGVSLYVFDSLCVFDTPTSNWMSTAARTILLVASQFDHPCIPNVYSVVYMPLSIIYSWDSSPIYVYICAFIVPKCLIMHFWPIHAHIDTYLHILHIFYYMKIPHKFGQFYT